ncbi:MAG: hypothetical protein KGY76_05290 [Candidatus Thermoplasmatota archaeon]|nr:hypothetical protein [Candidatus Thermoplasmatota archaeon]
MLQWLQSKMVLLTAGIILISSIIGVFYYRMDQMEDEERSNRCKMISRIIADMYSSNSDEMSQRITFEKGPEGIYLSPTVRGKPYDIEIWTDRVKVKQDGDTSTERFPTKVHLWPYRSINRTGHLDLAEERWRDERTPPLSLRAGGQDLRLTMFDLQNTTSSKSHIFISGVESA